MPPPSVRHNLILTACHFADERVQAQESLVTFQGILETQDTRDTHTGSHKEPFLAHSLGITRAGILRAVLHL